MRRRMATLILLAWIGRGTLAPAQAQAPDPGAGALADPLVTAIHAAIEATRRPLKSAEFEPAHARVVDLIAEFRAAHPADPRLARVMPARWHSLYVLDRRAAVYAELDRTLATATDPALRRDALFFQTLWRNLREGDEAVLRAGAEGFARAAPGDNRAAELFDQALDQSDYLLAARVGLLVALTAGGTVALAFLARPADRVDRAERRRRWRRVAFRVAAAGGSWSPSGWPGSAAGSMRGMERPWPGGSFRLAKRPPPTRSRGRGCG